MKNFKITLIIFLANFIFNQNIIALQNNADGTYNVFYEFSDQFAGFQFNTDGKLTNARDGVAGKSGFNISNGGKNNTVLGFSFEGSIIEPGSGILVVLEGSEITTLSNIIIASSTGTAVDFEYIAAPKLSSSASNNDTDSSTNSEGTNSNRLILYSIILAVLIGIFFKVRSDS